jgi:hypothetical protein
LQEVNHLNRIFNRKGQSSIKNSTPKNIILQRLQGDQPDGGRYKSAELFFDNLAYLSFEQAKFIVVLENWTSEEEINVNIKGKAILVESFINNFMSLSLIEPRAGQSERIKKMNNKEREIDTICWKPSN